MDVIGIDRPLSPAQILAREVSVLPADKVAVQVAASQIGITAGGQAQLAVTVPQLQQAIGIRRSFSPFSY